MKNISKAQCLKCLKEKSYREGDFTLASGQKSNFYLDVKQTALSPEGITQISGLFYQMFCETFSNEAQKKIKAVSGLTLGADPLVTGFSFFAYQQGFELQALIVRKEPKAHGTSKWIEGRGEGDWFIKNGSDVLVLEDVTTTGGSSLKAVDRLREEGLNPIGIFTVVDREQGARALIESKGLLFKSIATLTEIKSFY